MTMRKILIAAMLLASPALAEDYATAEMARFRAARQEAILCSNLAGAEYAKSSPSETVDRLAQAAIEKCDCLVVRAALRGAAMKFTIEATDRRLPAAGWPPSKRHNGSQNGSPPRAARHMLATDASGTAKPLFEKHGFVATRRNTIEIDGEYLGNTRMTKALAPKVVPDGER
jgi:hypothetical protein